jgi:hypothetical protein
MNTRAKVAVISVLIGMAAIAWSIPSWAHDRSYHHDHYREYYRHYHHNHRRKSDNDDWAWAVGGLILGGIIANSDKNRTESSVSLPPPQRRVQTCYDEVAYNSNNEPYVLRRCFETVE